MASGKSPVNLKWCSNYSWVRNPAGMEGVLNTSSVFRAYFFGFLATAKAAAVSMKLTVPTGLWAQVATLVMKLTITANGFVFPNKAKYTRTGITKGGMGFVTSANALPPGAVIIQTRKVRKRT